jgi:serine/threonine-protein kinase
MLTRRLPFEAESPVGVAMRHLHDAPPRPSALDPGVQPPSMPSSCGPWRKTHGPLPSAGAFARALRGWREADGRAAVNAAARDRGAAGGAPTPRTASGRLAGGAAPRRRHRRWEPRSPIDRAPPPPPPQNPRRATRSACATWATGSLILIA